MPLRFEELSPDNWRPLTELFGKNGAQGGCWCIWWRLERGGKLWEETKGSKARDRMRRLVKSERAHGMLAFDGETPVGWCSFGPLSDFPRVGKMRGYPKEGEANSEPGAWSINCFFIARTHRGRGVARGLLNAALKSIKRRGGTLVEAYPVTTTTDGRAVESAFAFTGPIGIFEQAGFKEVQRISPTRPLLRLELGKRASKRPLRT